MIKMWLFHAGPTRHSIYEGNGDPRTVWISYAYCSDPARHHHKTGLYETRYAVFRFFSPTCCRITLTRRVRGKTLVRTSSDTRPRSVKSPKPICDIRGRDLQSNFRTAHVTYYIHDTARHRTSTRHHDIKPNHRTRFSLFSPSYKKHHIATSRRRTEKTLVSRVLVNTWPRCKITEWSRTLWILEDVFWVSLVTWT